MGWLSSVLPAAVTGFLTGGPGGAVVAATTAYSSAKQNEQARKNAQAQMDFQERMSNTQYQRGMLDMRAAGLNPMLAFSQGGASSPGGASAPAVSELSEGVSSAMASARLKQELENMEEVNKNLRMDTALKNAQQNVADMQSQLTHQLVHKATEDTAVSARQAELLEAELPAARNRAEVEKSPVGEYGAWFDRILESVGLGRAATGARIFNPTHRFESYNSRRR